MACSRLFTFPPRPDFPRRSVPFFRRLIALLTLLPAPLLYFRPLLLRVERLRVVAISASWQGCEGSLRAAVGDSSLDRNLGVQPAADRAPDKRSDSAGDKGIPRQHDHADSTNSLFSEWLATRQRRTASCPRNTPL